MKILFLMHKIILEIQNTFYQIEHRWNATSIPSDTQNILRGSKIVLWNTQKFTNEIRKMFPQMHKTFPSSFPDLWYFLRNDVMFWFDKVGMWTEGMAWIEIPQFSLNLQDGDCSFS